MLSAILFDQVAAQTKPDAGAIRQQIDATRNQPLPNQVAPPSSSLPPALQATDGVTVLVERFEIQGNTRYPNADLQSLLAPWLNRPLDFSQLQAAAAAVAARYRQDGWVVRAYLPTQSIDQGVVTVQVVESLLGELRFEGEASQRVSQEELRRILLAQQATGQPLNAELLDRGFLIANDLSGVNLSSSGNLALNADITNNTSGDITLGAGNGTSSSTATLTAANGVVVTQNANANVVIRTDGQGNLTPAQVNKTGTGAGNIILAAGRLISAGTGTGGQVTPLTNSTVTNSGTGKLLVYSGTLADTGDLTAIDSSLGSLIDSGSPSSTLNLAYYKAYGSSISNGASSQVLLRENPNGITDTTNTVSPPFISVNLGSKSTPHAEFNLNLYLEEGLASQVPVDMDIPVPWHLLSSLGNGPLSLKTYDGRPLPNWVALDVEKKMLVLKQAPVSELPLRVWVVSGLQRSLLQVNKMNPKSVN